MDPNHQRLALHQPSGRLIDIREATRGLASNCICEKCGSPLIARQGKKRAWYFSHLAKTNCEGALMTLLHRAAIQIIQETKLVAAPIPSLLGFQKAEAMLEYPQPSSSTLQLEAAMREIREIIAPERHQLTNVVAERQDQDTGRRPDITCLIDGQPVFIEVRVTHAVDEEKLLALKERGIPTLEINLFLLHKDEKGFDMDDIKDAVLDDRYRGKWIVEPDHIKRAHALNLDCAEWINASHQKKEAISRSESIVRWRDSAFAVRDGRYPSPRTINVQGAKLQVFQPAPSGAFLFDLFRMFRNSTIVMPAERIGAELSGTIGRNLGESARFIRCTDINPESDLNFGFWVVPLPLYSVLKKINNIPDPTVEAQREQERRWGEVGGRRLEYAGMPGCPILAILSAVDDLPGIPEDFPFDERLWRISPSYIDYYPYKISWQGRVRKGLTVWTFIVYKNGEPIGNFQFD